MHVYSYECEKCENFKIEAEGVGYWRWKTEF